MISRTGVQPELARVDGLTAQSFVSDYVRRNLPVLITKEPAFQKATAIWSFDYLSAKHPGYQVRMEHYPNGDRNQPWAYATMEFSKYVELVRASKEARTQYYLASKPLHQAFPNCAGDIEDPSFLKNSQIFCCHVFAGIDTFSAAHYHLTGVEAVLTQIVGTKRIRLYPAAQFRLLYPHPWFSLRTHYSQIPFGEATDEELHRAYPRLKEATPIECLLQPGETLYIPQGWFHVVHGPGETVSSSFFFVEAARYGYLPLVLRDTAVKAYQQFLIAPLLRTARRFAPTRELVRKFDYFQHEIDP